MLVNYWDSADYITNVDESIKYDKNHELILTKMLNNLGENSSHLYAVEIETINRCNNDCSFCPANVKQDIRHVTKMDRKLFEKIIGELEEMNYSGRISYFSNCEPLLDDRIFEFIEYGKKHLPNAYHSLFTNGLLLNMEGYKKLIAHLDYLRINNYDDNLELYPSVKALIEEKIDEKNCQVVVEVRKKNQVLLNRGGLSPNNNKKSLYNSPCLLPFVQMVIRPDGKISRCCQDVYGNETLGDVSKESIMKAFAGEKYNEYRESMLSGNRCKTEYCSECDINGLAGVYPSDWDYRYLNVVIDEIVKQSSHGKSILLYALSDAHTFIDILNTYSVDIELTSRCEDLEAYLEEGYFVLFDRLTTEVEYVLRNKNCRVGEDYIIYPYKMTYAIKKTRNYNRELEIKRLKKVSNENSLIVFGAGETARKLISANDLNPVMIVDNNKAGSEFMGVVVEKPDILSMYKDKVILVATYDYYDIVEKLNDYGFSSKKIILGYKLLLG